MLDNIVWQKIKSSVMVNEAKSLCIVWPLYAVYMTQKGFWLFFIAQLVTNYSLCALSALHSLPPWMAAVPSSNKFLPLAKT